MGRTRRPPILATLLAGLLVAGCGPTPSPSSVPSPTAAAVPPSLASVEASPAASPPPSPSPSIPPQASASLASAAPPGGASPSPTPSGDFVPPALSAVRRFTCGTLVPAKTIAALTRIPAVYFDFARIPGLKPPSLPKGETECKALGSTTSGSRFVAMTTTITVLSGPSRTTIDQAWPQMTSVGRVVPGVGDAALFDSATMTLVGYRGGFAFSVTLEPFPLTLYASARVLVIETALARVLVSHLG